MISQRGFFLTGGIPSPRPTTTPQTTPHSMTYSKEASKPAKSSLTLHEFRMISSLPILFWKNITSLEDLAKLQVPQRASGYSIRVPKCFKRKLREILRDEGVHADSMYPPLRETVRLFEHVVDESLKK